MKNITSSPVTSLIGLLFIIFALGLLAGPYMLDTVLIYKGKKEMYNLASTNYTIPAVAVILGLLLVLAPDSIVKIFVGFLRKKEYIDKDEDATKPTN